MKIAQVCPGCAARRLEMSAAPCGICGRARAIEAPKRPRKPHFSARLLRWSLLPMGRWWRGFLVVAMLIAAREMTVNWIVFFLNPLSVFGGFLWWGLVGLWSMKLLMRSVIWLLERGEKSKRPGWKSFLALPLGLLLLLALDVSKLPLRVAFWVSHPALEKVRQQRSFQYFGAPPQRAGLYTVDRLDKSGSAARMQVTKSMFLSGTKAGFVFCPQGCGAVNFPATFAGGAFDKPTYIPLSSHWFWWQLSGDDF